MAWNKLISISSSIPHLSQIYINLMWWKKTGFRIFFFAWICRSFKHFNCFLQVFVTFTPFLTRPSWSDSDSKKRWIQRPGSKVFSLKYLAPQKMSQRPSWGLYNIYPFCSNVLIQEFWWKKRAWFKVFSVSLQCL